MKVKSRRGGEKEWQRKLTKKVVSLVKENFFFLRNGVVSMPVSVIYA